MMGKPQMAINREKFQFDNQIIVTSFNIFRTKDQ